MTEEINETRTVEKPEWLELSEEKYWTCNGKFTVLKRIQHFFEKMLGKSEIYAVACYTEDEALMQAKENEKTEGFIWDGKPPYQVSLNEMMEDAKRDGDTGVCIEQWTPHGWVEVEYYEVGR